MKQHRSSAQLMQMLQATSRDMGASHIFMFPKAGAGLFLASFLPFYSSLIVFFSIITFTTCSLLYEREKPSVQMLHSEAKVYFNALDTIERKYYRGLDCNSKQYQSNIRAYSKQLKLLNKKNSQSKMRYFNNKDLTNAKRLMHILSDEYQSEIPKAYAVYRLYRKSNNKPNTSEIHILFILMNIISKQTLEHKLSYHSLKQSQSHELIDILNAFSKELTVVDAINISLAFQILLRSEQDAQPVKSQDLYHTPPKVIVHEAA